MIAFLALLLAALISIIWTTLRYGIGPTPTSIKVKSLLFKNLPEISSGVAYELGAGFGNLAFSLASHYPHLKVKAIEISPFPFLWMKFYQILRPKKNLEIVYENLFNQDLSKAALIVCYLYPQAMKNLALKLKKECPNTIVITHTFALPDEIPSHIFYANDLYHTPLYLYNIYEKRN